MIPLNIVIKQIAGYQPKFLVETIDRAAVMVMIVADKSTNSLEIVLTKRAALIAYGGDYSFPGGRMHPEDENLYATAARELQEELNIAPDAYEHIGQLDDFRDRFGNMVRPFVVVMDKQKFVNLHKIAEVEIAEVYFFPLQHLHEIHDSPDLHLITRRRPSYSFTDDTVFIWGLTATILVHFDNVINNHQRSLGKEII